jgi:hypothetical protein
MVVSVFELTETNTGASGTLAATWAEIGVIELEGEDAGEGPTELRARTVNVYGVPFVNPLMIIGDDEPTAVIPPGFEITK